MTGRLLVLVFVLSIVALFFYPWTREMPRPAAEPGDAQPAQTAAGNLGPLAASGDTQQSAVPEENSGDADDCLMLNQLEVHPGFADDAARFDAVGTNGPTIDSYRGLSRGELQGLAEQRDSAAMAVLGAMALMRASGLPEHEAVPYLMNERNDLFSATQKKPRDDAAGAGLEEARTLFYQSALHGRLMALYYVGNLLWMEKGGAVKLGWIDEEAFDALSPYDQNSLLPPNLYNALAYEIAPKLATGAIGTVFFELSLSSEYQRPIVERLRDEFQRDLDAAGLPPISVPESATPSRDELKAMLCKTELERLEEARRE